MTRGKSAAATAIRIMQLKRAKQRMRIKGPWVCPSCGYRSLLIIPLVKILKKNLRSINLDLKFVKERGYPLCEEQLKYHSSGVREEIKKQEKKVDAVYSVICPKCLLSRKVEIPNIVIMDKQDALAEFIDQWYTGESKETMRWLSSDELEYIGRIAYQKI